MVNTQFEVDQEMLVKLSQPLFYGFTFLAGISLLISTQFAGTLLGLSVLSSIAFVSAGLASGLDDDWKRFLNMISISSTLMVVLFASFTAARLSMF